MTAATWAHAAFALGYAEDGVLPPTKRAQAACVAAQEMALESDDPTLGPFIVEAGRSEGKRSARESAHRKLYAFHSAALAAVIARILARLDTDAIAEKSLEVARQQSDAGYDPVTRRKAVQAVSLGAIANAVSDQDRTELDALNATGWSHATAYGRAEAVATPPSGGPPDPKKIAAASALALTLINPAEAAEAISTWTPMELQTIAMGAALAAGDGKALATATRAVKTALVDTGRATQTYADQLHGAVTDAYIAQTQAQTPGVLFNWETDADPCEDCEDYELENPYEAGDLPEYPAHPNCQCDIEAVSAALVDA